MTVGGKSVTTLCKSSHAAVATAEGEIYTVDAVKCDSFLGR